MITIYTDGSCDISKKIGGWAAVLIDNSGKEKILKGSYENATSNRMELMAVLQSLFLFSKPEKIKIITDSKYVEDAVNKGWLERWIRDEELERPHFELWRMFYNLLSIHDITVEWIKGHSGDKYNELCDRLANEEMLKASEKKKNLFDIAEKSDSWNESSGKANPFEDEIPNVFGDDLEETLTSMQETKKSLKELQTISKKTPSNQTEIPKIRTIPKQKKSPKKKNSSAGFYAVAVGRKKGVFTTWSECQKNVNKFPGAKFKKFNTKAEAENFIKSAKK